MNRHRTGVAPALFALGTALALHAASAAGAGAGEAAAAQADPAQVDRGRYLVTILGCNDCHTPWRMGENGPEPDMSRMLSGHPQQLVLPPPPALTPGAWESASWSTVTAWAGPWGISYTRNLTPDKETGLGSWTEKEFVTTLRTGRERGIGRELMPPMPWPAYGQATDADLAAVFAYLRSIPAIANRVPDNLPPAAPPAKP